MAKWLNREITWAASEGVEALLAVIDKRMQDFNAVNIATALHRLSRLLGDDAAVRKEFLTGKSFGKLLPRTVEILRLPPGPQCDARAVATIAHALASLGLRDEAAAEAVVSAAAQRLDDLDRQGLVQVSWSLAKLAKVSNTLALAQRIAALAPSFVRTFLAQELAMFSWSLARLGVRDNRLMSMLSDAARHNLNYFTTQGLATVVAAFARLGIFIEPLLRELAGAAQKRLRELNGRDVVQVLWAFAKFKLQDEVLFQALCSRAEELDFEHEGKEFIASFLWAFGTLHWLPRRGKLLEKLLGRAEILAPTFGAHRTVRILTAIVKLSDDPEALGKEAVARLHTLSAAFCQNIAELVDRMGAQEIGITSWAVATLQPEGWSEVLPALISRAAEVQDGLNWWSVAHLEYACRKLGLSDDSFFGLLSCRCAAEIECVQEESRAFQDGPCKTLAELEPWANATCLRSDASVLVFGPGRRIRRALRSWGAKVVPWRRFASGRVAGVATLAWAPAGPFDACVLRYPDSADAFELLLHAVATVLPQGAPLWICGDVREGVLSSTRAVRGLFRLVGAAVERGDVRVFHAIRTEGVAKGPLEVWQREATIDLGEGPQKWISFPGLFAGGLVDVMTKFLLESIASAAAACSDGEECSWLREGSCILDFACGTGVLAAGLKRCCPDAHFVLLDADTVALEAARQNLPDASAVILSDGLAGLDASADAHGAAVDVSLFDMIASNPPVHRGQADDLRVLSSLIWEAPARLRAGGELWLVAQEHIPVGRLFALRAEKSTSACGFAEVEMRPTKDGRFVVWRASCTKQLEKVPRRRKASVLKGGPQRARKRRRL